VDVDRFYRKSTFWVGAMFWPDGSVGIWDEREEGHQKIIHFLFARWRLTRIGNVGDAGYPNRNKSS
jgi:hypothetical protein